MSIFFRWWLRNCVKCRARKSSRLTVCCPIFSMPLPSLPYRTTVRRPSNELKWTRLSATNRSAVAVGSPWKCTIRIGRDSRAHLGTGKWTSRSLASRFYSAGPAPRTSAAEPAACTVGCKPSLHNGDILEERASVFSDTGLRLRAAWQTDSAATALQAVPPNGAPFWCTSKDEDSFWWLGKTSARTTTDGDHLVRFLDDPGRIKLPIPPVRYATSNGVVWACLCLKTRLDT